MRHLVWAAWSCVVFLTATAPPVDAQHPAMDLVSEAGHTFAYHVQGEAAGTPLLLINGGPGVDHQYFHLGDPWSLFSSTRPVIFFDQPGTGQSSPIMAEDTLTVAAVVAGMDAIRRQVGAERLSVVGHSWGGYLAVAYADTYPEHAESVILVAPMPPKVSEMETLFAPLWPDSLARGSGWRTADPAHLQQDIRRHLTMSFYSPEISRTVLGGLVELPYNSRQGRLLYRDADAHDLTEAASHFTMPVLVATGRFDANVSPRTAWRVHQAVPGSQFSVWEQSGHYPMVEEPAAFFHTLEEFVSANRTN